eukprot:TRINITY_DN3462_c0_g2_i1.p1 TRINITY_DN3462_c0_g2~~TRINITY_DN3462_c0_g2_i1.p1  ORF type:complete len:527 (+),score=137.45 TRINITY_DN3462_c0_g2_i1:163-1743(+)
MTRVRAAMSITWIALGHTRDLNHIFNNPLPHSWPVSFLFGFASGMLGITGYETACNYIEQQAEGVYELALRNMWLLVAVVNPLISFFCMAVMDVDTIEDNKEDLLNHMGAHSIGDFMNSEFNTRMGKDFAKDLVAADAFIVLTGSVLTAFVGSQGLIARLASDGCLPQGLLKENEFRKTKHRIILGFCLTCLAVLGITRGSVSVLAGVYSCGFVCVMTGMGLCHYVFKIRCPYVKRPTQVGSLMSVLAMSTTVVALVCQAAEDPQSFFIAAGVLLPLVALSQATIQRQRVLAWLAGFEGLHDWATDKSERMGQKLQLVYFVSGAEGPEKLIAILRTIERNEVSRRVAFVHVPEAEDEAHTLLEKSGHSKLNLPRSASKLSLASSVCTDVTEALEHNIEPLRDLFPSFEIQFESKALDSGFGPEAVLWAQEEFGVQVGQMAIGVPGMTFRYGLGELGGVRIMNLDYDILVTHSVTTQQLVSRSRRNSYEESESTPTTPGYLRGRASSLTDPAVLRLEPIVELPDKRL